MGFSMFVVINPKNIMLTKVFLSTQIMLIYSILQRFLKFLKIFFDDYFNFLTYYG
jgi:hypothetical protein